MSLLEAYFLSDFALTLDTSLDEEDEEERDDELCISLSLLDEDEFGFIFGFFDDIDRKFVKLI